ncbi:MAG: CDP-diacylglycerol--serine O-phosphatidyltransferase [Prevotellaceae bacterium]|jgi:CDP-diacylglycerol--serine O-phosphatidyltransferase|nr:CDP-diacylglycerol--serine O-phosphatidyltransferase [Prevotellaceae bacterium]
MRKIINSIPNILTSGNLFCGCIAVVLALNGDIETATYFIFAAVVFDFFDGFAARLLKAQSSLGLQLDSLADMVSFGVAPSAIVFHIMSIAQIHVPLELPAFTPYFAFFIAVFSALRLAKFNIDERQTAGFIGLPTPACSLFFCGLTYFDLFTVTGFYVLSAFIPLFCFLLVCELPMFSLKIKKTPDFAKKYSLQLLLVFSAVVFIAIWRLKGISITIAFYITLSILVKILHSHNMTKWQK